MSQIPETEFSRPFKLSELGAKEVIRELSAGTEERRALAERFELLSLDHLQGTLRLKKVKAGRGLHLSGTIKAGVVQQCVVSLEPIETEIEEEVFQDFDLLSEDELEVPQGGSADELAFDPVEDREPLNGNMIDLGEFLAQQMAVSLPPYPRKPGVELEQNQWGSAEVEAEAEDKASPFSKLKDLKKNR